MTVPPARRGTDPPQFEDADELFANLPEVVREFKRSRKRQAFLLAFMLLVGIVGGLALQHQADAIRASTDADRITLSETRATAFAQCKIANDNAVRLNRFLDQVIRSVQTAPGLTRAERQQRIVAYSSIKAGLPVCRRP